MRWPDVYIAERVAGVDRASICGLSAYADYLEVTLVTCSGNPEDAFCLRIACRHRAAIRSRKHRGGQCYRFQANELWVSDAFLWVLSKIQRRIAIRT